MSPPQRPGKTAQRLVQDIYYYDPAHPPGTCRNLLSEVPPVYTEHYTGPPDYIAADACQHDYKLKLHQSSLPAHGQGSKVSAICSKCRYHLQVVVSYTDGISQTDPQHIHHLVYTSGRQKGGGQEEVTPQGQVAETFHYQCSYLTCSAAVSVRIVSPILNPERVKMLVDPVLLQERADEAIAAHPERLEGVGRPLPINVLDNLRIYISNALYDTQRSKSISAVNKRFMVCFGVEGRPCKDLLELLGFTKNDGFWEPPRPSPSQEVPFQDPLKIFLDDVLHELSALIEQRPLSEKRGHQSSQSPRPAYDNLRHALGFLEYPKAQFAEQFQMPGAPFYEDLGVVEDMPSSAIVEAFNRQVSVDPVRAPLYLHCLKSIGILRGGEDGEYIQGAVQLAYAEGRYTQEDVFNAYRYFGLGYDDPNLTDESIIGKFYAFLSATTHEAEARRQLWRIGDSRRSERIKSAAEDRVTTVEQAQIFLGVDENTSDDFVITMYTTKINDSPSSKDIARRALELIAQHRKSDTLTNYLKTGEMGVIEMDVGDAYRLLQIPDRTADDAAIMAAYTICVDEAPGQVETYNRALSIIAKEMNSPLLGSIVAGSTTQSDRDLWQWPVGLQNIGNTCYLNSLLQFYFSVRPFRDMVLDFETFKMSLDEESLSAKQVGSRKVLRKEVERSQRFLRELRILFLSMIGSSQPWVTPGQELARLTLISPTNEAAIRRRSTISGSRSGGLGEINGVPIMGPLGPPQQVSTGDEPREQNGTAARAESEKAHAVKGPGSSDADSEATLVSDSVRHDMEILLADDKENAPPPLPDEVMTGMDSEMVTEADDGNHGKPREPIGPPNRPPPVPPRPVPQVDRQKQLIEEVEIGAQQDVTEVINNVLFQSQCAIRPLAIGPDGEQHDQVKDLFYGKTKTYISGEGPVRSKEEWFCDIKVDVATGPRNIYSAIDGAFDVQQVHVGGTVAEQFSAISKIPPVLQIQVQRVQFDPVKKSSFKSTHHLDIKETVYMDRYMDTQDSDIVNRRRQCWEWKNELNQREARRTELLRKNENDRLDMPTLFDSAKGVLEELDLLKENPETIEEALDIDSQLPLELDQLSKIAKSELTFVEQEIRDTQTKISSQFADLKFLAYRLYAVFVHHGSVEFGHYYIYIYDFKKHVWRKYNDNEVTEVHNPDEIFKKYDSPNPPTPYFLVYVKEGMEDILVDPVCRRSLDLPLADQTYVEADTTTAMEGVTATRVSEDGDVELPSYDEVWSHNGPPDSANHSPAVSSTVNPLKRKGVEEAADTNHSHLNPVEAAFAGH